ncbi:Ig-like domain-containing protein [Dyadobacter arcticus]|uniref:DUF1566 domain-containing protein n=1 Tax=Dyadobacter arcticus TaxID=1078754 RepID=A0ABX0UNG9_9BACT|nr:Ig-like domain-containing protein [Dyadobacter arcticus]NIJ54472.1 hypothetical protein [Dyadobacter arcticus]
MKNAFLPFALMFFWSCSGSKDDKDLPFPDENITVAFVTPVPTSDLAYNKAYDLEVSATGDVKSVEFFLDGKSIGSVAARPYKISWTARDLDPGSHQLKAIATSAKRNEFKSEIEIALKLALGDDFRGGRVFEIDPSGNHGLIAAKEDLADEKGQPQYLIWGADGMIGTSFEDGIENTRKISVQATGPNQMGDRFKGNGLEINGFKDWYIPSFFELGTLRGNAALVGGFSKIDREATYWSSSERNLQQAFYINFVSVKEVYNFRTVKAKVRPIRKF